MNEENKQAPESNIAGGPMAPDQNTPVDVVDVQFRAGSKIYYFDPDGLTVTPGDHVIIETARGPEYAPAPGATTRSPSGTLSPSAAGHSAGHRGRRANPGQQPGQGKAGL